MAAQAMAKPQLRNLLKSSIKMNLVGSITFAIITGFAYRFGICEPRKKAYAEFYKNYDAEKEFQRMKKAGLFQSC